MLAAFVRFTRPHTMIATAVQVISLLLIAGGIQIISWNSISPVLLTLLTCLALNIYIVGLNQITDVEIDSINKPELPLASQAMTMWQGWVVVVLTAILALTGALLAGPFLLGTVLIIMTIGTVYSVPPLRLKRFSFWAAISIALARGVVANIGVALHYNDIFGGLDSFSPATLTVMAAFFFGFGLVIAIYKDIPDLMGDEMHGIQTFTVKLGAQGAFNLGRFILTVGYLGIILVALTQLPQPGGILLLVAQMAALALFWLTSSRVDPQQKSSIAHFYMFLWALFYAQYIVLSLVQVTKGIT
jgi:homogentisate phytyltransferase / homogentisate geranylgeranyltransferase